MDANRSRRSGLGRLVAASALVAIGSSLAIGYVRAHDSSDAAPLRDALEVLVGASLSVVAGALVVAAFAPLRERWRRSTAAESDLPVAIDLGIALVVVLASAYVFFEYVFGWIGIAIRTFVAGMFA